MAVSRTPKSVKVKTFGVDTLRVELSCEYSSFAVAYSAGRDSTALLHAALQAAYKTGQQVFALHVHHGLSSQADTWVQHATEQCQIWRAQGLPVQLLVHYERSHVAPGQSLEAWARGVRYAALRQMALESGLGCVMLAHHQRDQAETWLLQALRGGGVAAWASMPYQVQRDGMTWLRPWLNQPRAYIERYVQQHQLTYVDDDSNQATRFDRNRLRLQVWPVLQQAFGQAEINLSTAAQWAQEAHACLQELADHDLADIAHPQGFFVKPWLALSPARQSNALRAWLKLQTGTAAAASCVQRLQRELPGARHSSCWRLSPGSAQLRYYRGYLSFSSLTRPFQIGSERGVQTTVSVDRIASYPLAGWGGVLHVEPVKEGGAPWSCLADLELRQRMGAERFQLSSSRPARSLKKQFQLMGVPAWERSGPLIYSQAKLLFVPNLGIDVRMQALPGEPQVMLRWQVLES
jgi:tRNA(Ile)-lysidine synthase